MAALRIFIFFPVNEDSTASIINSQGEFDDFLSSIVNFINIAYKHREVQVLYDDDNVNNFINSCKNWDNDIYIGKASDSIRIALGQRSLEITTNYDSLKSFNCSYFLWNLNDFNLGKIVQAAPKIVIEAAERLFNFPEESILLLNFNSAIYTDRPVLLVFKDEFDLQNPHPQDPPLPYCFAHIPIAITEQQLLDWIETFAKLRQLKVSPNFIQDLINKGQTESVFERIHPPKILGEKLHMHFKNGSALNFDGTWKHGFYHIPVAAKTQLKKWGFTLPE